MKGFVYVILFLVLSITVSCKKDNIEPNEQPNVAQVEQIRLYGKWLLIGGSMYMTNMETNVKTKYNHFGPDKSISSLDYNGADIEFEVIELNTTTWSFYEPPSVPGFGEFVLNGNLNKPYGFYVTKSNWTIMEHPQSTQSNMQMGGSSRPISATIHNYSDSTVYFYVQYGYTSINNQNYSYFSELKFKKIESW
jgi:hypothetical protein